MVSISKQIEDQTNILCHQFLSKLYFALRSTLSCKDRTTSPIPWEVPKCPGMGLPHCPWLPCFWHPRDRWLPLCPESSFVRTKSPSSAEDAERNCHAVYAPWIFPFPMTSSDPFALISLLPYDPSNFATPSLPTVPLPKWS